MTEIIPALGLSAYFLGRRIAGQRRKQDRVPVAYLYNGVRLPALPEWDRVKYPYVILSLTAKNSFLGDSYSLRMPENNSVVTYGDGVQAINCNGNSLFSNIILTKDWEIEGRAWPPVEKYSLGELNNYIDLEKILWSNFNIYNTDGTLYLAASEPIPVYE